MSNIRDVAKKANVSITTVSRILSRDPSLHVSNQTKENVMDAIRELNYTYKPKKTQIHIGCILSLTYNYADPYFSNILNGIQTYCSKHNAVISMIVSYEQFKESRKSLEKQMEDLDGFIITETSAGQVEYFKSLNKKMVFVDNFVPGYCNVGFDVTYANRLIFEHLQECNYKRIAYIGGPDDNMEFEDTVRMMELREFLRKNHQPFEPDLYYNCEWDSKICAKQVRELLSKHRDIDVIFAGSDSLATAVIRQLYECGLRCPDDIGVIGFNDNYVSQNFSPTITTVRLPSREMGELAAKVLIDQIVKDESFNIQLLLPVRLKKRQSTTIKLKGLD